MSPLYRPFIVPRFGRVTEFLRPHFRITSGYADHPGVERVRLIRISERCAMRFDLNPRTGNWFVYKRTKLHR